MFDIIYSLFVAGLVMVDIILFFYIVIAVIAFFTVGK